MGVERVPRGEPTPLDRSSRPINRSPHPSTGLTVCTAVHSAVCDAESQLASPAKPVHSRGRSSPCPEHLPQARRRCHRGSPVSRHSASPEFQELRSKLRRFVFPMTAFFLVWYLRLRACWARSRHDFMAIKVMGNINVGLLIGLRPVRDHLRHHRVYVRFANSELDPAPRPSARSWKGERGMNLLAATARPSATLSPTSASSCCSSWSRSSSCSGPAATTRTAADFYTGGRAFTGPQNGIAIAGDYLSAASFLGIAGRYRGLRLRRLPLLDRLPGRLAGRAAAGRRIAAQHRQVHDGRRAELPAASSGRCGWPRRPSTLAVSLFYLLAQMAGAGGLVALLLDINERHSARAS